MHPLTLAGRVARDGLPRLLRHALPLWLAALALGALAAAAGLGPAVVQDASTGLLGAVVAGLWGLSAWRSAAPALLTGTAAADLALARSPARALALLVPAVAAALPVAVIALVTGHGAHAGAWVLAAATGIVAGLQPGAAGMLGGLAGGALAGLLGPLPGLPAAALALLAFLILAPATWARARALQYALARARETPPAPARSLPGATRQVLAHAWLHAGAGLVGATVGAGLAVAWLATAAGAGGLPAAWRGPAVAILAGFACVGPVVALAEARARAPLSAPRGARVLACLVLCTPLLLALGLAAHSVEGLLRGLATGVALAVLTGVLTPRAGARPFPVLAFLALATGVVALAALPWPLPLLPLAAGLGGLALCLRRGRPGVA